MLGYLPTRRLFIDKRFISGRFLLCLESIATGACSQHIAKLKIIKKYIDSREVLPLI